MATTFVENLTYSIEIAFKDGRYKFNPISISYYNSPSKYGGGGDIDIYMPNTSVYYNKNGDIKNMVRTWPSTIESLFNNLNISLYNHILVDKSELNPDDDW